MTAARMRANCMSEQVNTLPHVVSQVERQTARDQLLVDETAFL